MSTDRLVAYWSYGLGTVLALSGGMVCGLGVGLIWNVYEGWE